MAICLLNINACWPMLVFHLELIDFKTRRVAAFRKNLVELAELELKHAKVSFHFILWLFNDFRSMDYLLMICPDLSLSRGIYNCCRAVWGSWKGTLRFLNQVLCIGLSLLWSRLHSEDGGENIPGVSLSKETSVLTTTRDTILPPQPPLKVRQSTVEDQPIHTAQDIRLHLITHF